MFKILLYFSLLAVQGCSNISSKSLQGLDASIRQAIIVSPTKKNSNQASLSAWQKQGKAWHRMYFVSAVIGQNGLAAANEKGIEIRDDIVDKRLKEINCYRGTRHTKHLPLRGQRTKTNSRTVRGNKRVTAVSGKAKAGLKT